MYTKLVVVIENGLLVDIFILDKTDVTRNSMVSVINLDQDAGDAQLRQDYYKYIANHPEYIPLKTHIPDYDSVTSLLDEAMFTYL